MKNKGLLLSAALATVLFAGNALGLTVGRTQVNNKTGADIWVTFNKATFGCLSGPVDYGIENCSYNLVEKNKSRKTLSSVTGSKLVVYGYESKDGVVTQLTKEYNVTTDQVDVTIESGKIVVKDVGDSYSVKVEKNK